VEVGSTSLMYLVGSAWTCVNNGEGEMPSKHG
jgi:hypothetical protein